jgi:group I intron endonuclease
MTLYYIYKTINLINGKIYVGKRQCKCEISSDRYLGSGRVLQSAIKKHGIKNFKKEILEICKDNAELNLKEIYWIEKLDSTNMEIGYNLTKGGTGGDTWTLNPNKEQIREKTRLLSTGRKHSEETKSKLRDIKKGVPLSEEHKANLSKNHADFKGYKHSDVSRANMSKAKKGTILKKPHECLNCGRMISSKHNLKMHYNKCIPNKR